MTELDDHNPPATPREQALHWFSKARLGVLSPQEQREFDAWRAANPEHDWQYRSLESLWSIADQLPDDEMRAVLDQVDAGAPASHSRRRLVMGMGATCAAAAVIGVVGRKVWLDAPLYTARFVTTKGERGQWRLPDGSILDLNTATQVAVAFYDQRRVVELIAGEALFSVSPDASRPFTVDAGHAQVLVTGTRFNVRRDRDAVSVAVQEGTVEFSAGPWWGRRAMRLTAGYVSRASDNEALVTPYRDDVAALVSWQRGRLVFQDTLLSQVVAELNRYLAQPLRLQDGRIGHMRISGTVGIDMPESVLDLLPEIAPVTVLRLENGASVLAAR